MVDYFIGSYKIQKLSNMEYNMKLTHIRIQNFKSILNTGKISIGELCCLVGKNEAGKTATLTALQSILPFGEAQTTFDVTQDYPRRFATRYKERHPNEDAVVVETWWKISEEAFQRLADEFGEEAITSRELKISKHYNQTGTTWSVPIDEQLAIVHAIAAQRLNAVEKKVVEKAATVKELIDSIRTQGGTSEKLKALSKQFEEYRNHSVFSRGIDLISDLVPKFFYISHYDRR